VLGAAASRRQTPPLTASHGYHCGVPAQLDLPFLLTSAPGTPLLSIDFVRVRRARKYILRVRPDGTVRVTIPRGGSRAEAQRFVERHTRWLEHEHARVRSAYVTPVWVAGATMWLRGQAVTIRLEESAGRQFARYGDRGVPVPRDAIDLRMHIQRDLRRLAREELGARLRELAAEHSLTVAGITIRNQQSRWGSCSRAGRIALNYRLVQMPRAVSDYVLIHELMHLKQQNHSLRFWRLVEAACPGFREAEAWLKRHGRGLL
jgi:predicted metal-dependent hydrolase